MIYQIRLKGKIKKFYKKKFSFFLFLFSLFSTMKIICLSSSELCLYNQIKKELKEKEKKDGEFLSFYYFLLYYNIKKKFLLLLEEKILVVL